MAAHAGAGGVLGPWGAALAALLAALSPAMVFYSRYYIHETPLVVASFGALLAAWSWLRRPSAAAALLGGACAGLMLATKETASLALGALALALTLTAVSTPAPDAPAGERAAARLGASCTATTRGSRWPRPCWSRPRSSPRSGRARGGVADAVRAYGYYFERSGTPWHGHAWDYYLRLLAHFPATGTPFWTEGLILVLAAAGGVAAFTRAPEAGADPRGLRLLALYTLVLLAVYCAIPYKTPWCVLGFLHGMVLLAGPGAVYLVRLRAAGGRASRARPAAARGDGAPRLAGVRGRLPLPGRPPQPVRLRAHRHGRVPDRVAPRGARAGAPGRPRAAGPGDQPGEPLAAALVPAPLPERGLVDRRLRRGAEAPVVLITPDMEPALVRKLYELPPPGERELYVSAFERPVELRPQVELRGYVANGLWSELQRLEPAPPAGR